jgi:hypothetical protein
VPGGGSPRKGLEPHAPHQQQREAGLSRSYLSLSSVLLLPACQQQGCAREPSFGMCMWPPRMPMRMALTPHACCFLQVLPAPARLLPVVLGPVLGPCRVNRPRALEEPATSCGAHAAGRARRRRLLQRCVCCYAFIGHLGGVVGSRSQSVGRHQGARQGPCMVDDWASPPFSPKQRMPPPPYPASPLLLLTRRHSRV